MSRASASNFSGAKKDAMTAVTTQISYEHHEIHSGNFYSNCKVDLSMSTNDTIKIAFTTPATASPQKRIHMVSRYHVSDSGLFTILEDVTELVVASGATFTPKNHLRGSIKTSAIITPVEGITGADITYTGGATLCQVAWGGTKGRGTVRRGIDEWVLAPSTSYVFILQNLGTNSMTGDLALYWYEHTDSNR